MKFLSPRTHTIIGTVVAIALLLAPNLFGFSDVGDGAATIPRVLGVIILLSELIAKGSYSGMGFVPMKLHIITDIFLGAFLALSPWLYGFNDESMNAWLPHLIVGIGIIIAALCTRTNTEAAITPGGDNE